MTTSRNVTDSWEDLGDNEVMPKSSPLVELGVTGIKRTGGYLDEEFLPALRGRKAVRIFREMSENDSMVGALLFTIDKLVREVDWKVTPCDQTPEALQAAEFLESCKDDMSHSWDDFIGEVLSMIVYGWSWHEIVYKRRLGPWQKDASKKSKYDDGLIGWRKMPIRSQETLMRWVFDDKGGIKGMIQMAPPSYKQTPLPIEKSLLFRTTVAKGNPEGKSLLRTAYRSWYFKKRLEEFEAIGVERDLAGMPVGKLPSEYFNAKPGTPQEKMLQAYRKMVRGVRRDENEGLVLPVAYDPDTKQELFGFELLSAGGSRSFDTNAIIQRYEQRILMSVLADFILVGHQENGGSYALHTDKTGIFRAALNAITKSIADTLNRHAVPKLFETNGWKLNDLPKFEPTNIDPPDLTQLASFISATAGAGMQWFPDPELEKFVRDIARLPEMDNDTLELKRQMFEQTTAMDFAQTQMGLLGMQQKAELTAQGYSPEQAEMASQLPTPEMQTAERLGADEAELQHMQHPVGQQEQAMMAEQMDMQRQAQDQAGPLAQQQAELEERKATSQFSRDKAKADDDDKRQDKSLKREKEKLSLQDQIEDRKHKRKLAEMKASERQARFKKPPTKGEKK